MQAREELAFFTANAKRIGAHQEDAKEDEDAKTASTALEK